MFVCFPYGGTLWTLIFCKYIQRSMTTSENVSCHPFMFHIKIQYGTINVKNETRYFQLLVLRRCLFSHNLLLKWQLFGSHDTSRARLMIIEIFCMFNSQKARKNRLPTFHSLGIKWGLCQTHRLSLKGWKSWEEYAYTEWFSFIWYASLWSELYKIYSRSMPMFPAKTLIDVVSLWPKAAPSKVCGKAFKNNGNLDEVFVFYGLAKNLKKM